jgi:hypothetical protein
MWRLQLLLITVHYFALSIILLIQIAILNAWLETLEGLILSSIENFFLVLDAAAVSF